MAQASPNPRAKRNSAATELTVEGFGRPNYDRRLSDKILAAFTHAYASGAKQTAERLRAVLADVETSERRLHDRRSTTALRQAELWIAFVEARNAYNTLQEGEGATSQDLATALEHMKDAYRVWSDAA